MMEDFSDIKCFVDWGPYAEKDEHIWESCDSKFQIKCRVCKVSLESYDFKNHQPCKVTFFDSSDIYMNSSLNKKKTSNNNHQEKEPSNHLIDHKIPNKSNNELNSTSNQTKNPCYVKNETKSCMELKHNFYRFKCFSVCCDFCKLPIKYQKHSYNLSHSSSTLSLTASPSQLLKNHTKFTNTSTIHCLQCITCKKVIHDSTSCLDGMLSSDPICSYGILSRYVILPQWIIKHKNTLPSNLNLDSPCENGEPAFSMQQSFSLRLPEELPKNSLPILVFINTTSGDKQGFALYNNFLTYLNPRQIFLLPIYDPYEVLDFFKSIPKLTIIICAGDGSMSWIASSIFSKNLEQNVQICCVPLGTGNDLSNQLNWGHVPGDIKNFSILNLIKRINISTNIQLDAWSIDMKPLKIKGKIQSNKKYTTDLKNNMFLNYCSFGADARIAFYFNKERMNSPHKVTSRFDNLFSYFTHSLNYLIKQPYSYIFRRLELYCDDKDYTKVLRDHNIQIVLLLNIRYYCGGLEPWVSSSDPETDKLGSQMFAQDIGDGYIEVVGISLLSLLKMATINQGAYKIAQCRKVRIINNQSLHMQMDGEPYIIDPSETIIKNHGKINACFNTYQATNNHKRSDSFSLKIQPSRPSDLSIKPPIIKNALEQSSNINILKKQNKKIIENKTHAKINNNKIIHSNKSPENAKFLDSNHQQQRLTESPDNNLQCRPIPKLVHHKHRRSISLTLFESQNADGTQNIDDHLANNVLVRNLADQSITNSPKNVIGLNSSKNNIKEQQNKGESSFLYLKDLSRKFWINTVPIHDQINKAISNNQLKEVLRIINENPGIDYNQLDANGNTLLHCAIKTNNTFMISLLLINGADPYIKNIEGLNCFKLIKRNLNWQENYLILKQLSK